MLSEYVGSGGGFAANGADAHLSKARVMVGQCYGDNLRIEDCKVKALIAIAEALIAVASKMKG